MVIDVRISSSFSATSRAPEWTEVVGVVRKQGASRDERETLAMWITADITFKAPDVRAREITAGTTYKNQANCSGTEYTWQRVHETIAGNVKASHRR